LGDTYNKWVILPYGRLFTTEQLNSHPEFFSPVVIVEISLDDWAEYMRNAPTETVSPRDEEAELLFGFGQLVIWPFFSHMRSPFGLRRSQSTCLSEPNSAGG
jgi:hypothetical protein